jgi:hypothetical protein
LEALGFVCEGLDHRALEQAQVNVVLTAVVAGMAKEQEAATLGKSIFTTSAATTPKLSLTPPPKLAPKASFTVNNPLRAGVKRKDSTYVPTLKSVESVANSSGIPEIPEELTRSPTPPRGESPSS